jgi:para-nitrobenzyl esterase
MSTRSNGVHGWLAALAALGLVVSCSGGGDGGESRSDVSDPADELRVTVDEGVVRGDRVGGSRRFLKIPYAAPPVGERRWRAPERPEPWDGVRRSTRFGSACPQNASAQGPASREEDCLYANVWSPSPAPQDAPVMVWIHGGGNFAGSAADLVPGTEQRWYDGQFLASRHGAVVVTFNYRLGPLGFFPLPALADEGSPLGNQGLLDQRRLLEWVHDNIAAFGGDPGNVTIFGESAGSADVCYHVASPGSRGLFHRAISQSGGCTWSDLAEATDDDKAASMEAFAAAVGCDQTGAALVRCLRGLSTEQIMRQAQQPEPSRGDIIGAADWSFGPVVDGEDGVLPTQPRRLFDRHQIAEVPYLLGSNNDEGRVFVFTLEVTTQQQYEAQVRRRFPRFAAEVLRRYPASDFGGDYQAALAAAVGDSGLICGTADTARRAAAAGLPVYMYNFDIPWAISPDALRATHAAEMSHVFGNPLRPDEASRTVGDAMSAYWAAFAATGDPNYDGAPTSWPAFEAGDGGDRRLQLDGDFDVIEDFRADECAFWREHLG